MIFDDHELLVGSDALRQLATDLTHKFALNPANVPFKMSVKVREKGLGMRHARFIFTDQVHLLVERGFDLLKRDGTVRDVVVGHFTEPGKVVAEVNKLQDTRSFRRF